MRRMCACHAVNVSAIGAHWLFIWDVTLVNALILAGSVAVSSRSMARSMFMNASTVTLGPMCVLSVVVASSSARCSAITCVPTRRNVLMAVQRATKPSAITICGTCTNAFTPANSRWLVSDVQHASSHARLSAVTWEHTRPSATATVASATKAFHSAVICALTWEFIPERNLSSVSCVDSSLHTTVHWKNTISDTAVVMLYWV